VYIRRQERDIMSHFDVCAKINHWGKEKNMLYLAVYIPVSPWPGTARECFGIYLMIKDKILTNFKDR
jgi:hypothetical protein